MSNGVEKGIRQILQNPNGALLGAEYGGSDDKAADAPEYNDGADHDRRMGAAARLGHRLTRNIYQTAALLHPQADRDTAVAQAIRDSIARGEHLPNTDSTEPDQD